VQDTKTGRRCFSLTKDLANLVTGFKKSGQAGEISPFFLAIDKIFASSFYNN
jgi:hypothetical protein